MAKRGARQGLPLAGGRRVVLCALEGLESRRLLSSTLVATPAVTSVIGNGLPAGYSPLQILTAYGFTTAAANIGAVGGDGSGQTIAIVEAHHDPSIVSDLHAFDQQFGLANPPSLTEVSQTGKGALPTTDVQWSLETSLDVEWAHAAAPGANIIIVEADSSQLSDLLTAVDTARHIPSVSVVSMSWGVNEFPDETTYDSIFTTPANHQNVTFVASSGDKATAPAVQWPATSPNVVAVGGSTLTTPGTSQITGPNGFAATVVAGSSEVNFAGADSGVSAFEPTPVYQQATTNVVGRTIPDVVYNADPRTGFAVYDHTNGGWQSVGGTSSGAPQWAALLVIANEARVDLGKTTLDGADQTLPDLYRFYSTNVNATITTSKIPPIRAGALLNDVGAAQIRGVIGALTDSDNLNMAAFAGGEVSAKSIAKLSHKTAHPLILNFPPPRSLILSATIFSVGAHDIPAALTSVASPSAPLARAESIATSLTGAARFIAGQFAYQSDGSSTTPPMAFTQIGSISTGLLATVNVPMSGLGADGVVPVGANLMADLIPHGTWYIAHVDLAATFGDAISRFVHQSSGNRAMVAELRPPRDHTRAWAVTASVVAVDAVALAYLASRRRRKSASLGYVKWWV